MSTPEEPFLMPEAMVHTAFAQILAHYATTAAVYVSHHFGENTPEQPSLHAREGISDEARSLRMPLGTLVVEARDAGEPVSVEGDPCRPVFDSPLDRFRNGLDWEVMRGETSTERKGLEYMLDEERLPAGLQAIIENNGQSMGGWPEGASLLQKAVKRRRNTFVMTNDALLNILEWHGRQAEAAHTAYTQERLPKYFARLSREVIEAVATGQLPPVVLSRMHAVRERTTQTLDDGTQTWIAGAAGTYKIAHDAVSVGEEDYSTFAHENSHAMQKERDARDNTVLGTESSLQLLMAEQPTPNSVVLVEAITSMVEARLQGGSIYMLCEDQSRDESAQSYPAERELLDALCRFGASPVDVRRFIDASFEGQASRDALGERSAGAGLERALRRAFPDDYEQIISHISTLSTHSPKETAAYAFELKERNPLPAIGPREKDFAFAQPKL
jgi:hypothetical protein